jgi:hypothetical protein
MFETSSFDALFIYNGAASTGNKFKYIMRGTVYILQFIYYSLYIYIYIIPSSHKPSVNTLNILRVDGWRTNFEQETLWLSFFKTHYLLFLSINVWLLVIFYFSEYLFFFRYLNLISRVCVAVIERHQKLFWSSSKNYRFKLNPFIFSHFLPEASI